MGPRLPRLALRDAQGLLSNTAQGMGRHRLLLLALATLAAVGVVAWLLFPLGGKSGPRYVLVIDAGSSGTRMYAYTWQTGVTPVLAAVPSSAAAHKVPRRAMPDKRAYQRVETEPGLDQFVGDEPGLQAKALGPLLDWAEAVVPQRQWVETPIFLFGTAGLRRLSAVQQKDLLDEIRNALQRSVFRFRPTWARIISGVDEGVYSWVALNYMKGTLLPGGSSTDTVGALDLGGSSLEVTFAAHRVQSAKDTVNVTVFGASHQLYAHVHHHYGLNDAFDRSVSILLQQHRESPASADGQQQRLSGNEVGGTIDAAVNGDSMHNAAGGSSNGKNGSDDVAAAEKAAAVAHPCLHDGYSQHYSRLQQDNAAVPDPPRVLLTGSSDYAACRQLAQAVVNASVPCSAPPCALGIQQPSSVGRHFVALTGFFVVYKFFRLAHNASVTSLEEVGQQFCAKSWAEAQQDRPGELMLENYCFRAPYIAALVRQGLLLQDEQLEIGGGEVGWTLGAALAEGHQLASLGQDSIGGGVLFNQSWAIFGFGRLGILGLLGVAAAVFGFIYTAWKHGCAWSRRRGAFNKLATKGSAELLDLANGSPFKEVSDRAGLVGSAPLSSRGTPPLTSRNVWWAATPGLQSGDMDVLPDGGSAARPRSQSWAALGSAGGPNGAVGSSDIGAQREGSYSSNLNRLGRTRTFSRRNLATASPEGGE